MLSRREFLRYAGLATAMFGSKLLTATPPDKQTKPNILIIIADDCTYNDLPTYGGQNASTPNIDRLASEGLVFNRAYLGSAMCQPCRAELYTGQYPMRNGCAWNHSASRPDTTSIPDHLKPLGYRVGLAGKVHVKPAEAFSFDKVAGFDESCTRNPTRPHDVQHIRRFMAENQNQPFCLVVALVEPHVPWAMGDASKYAQQELRLPENIADTPLTREAFARYLAEITYMDGQVGEILKGLDESGRAGNTLVLLTSEQGSQFPGCKWTNWDTGLHTALVARWPGIIKPGQRTNALVQYADVLPTIVDVAGGDASAHAYDGTSFLQALLSRKSVHRKFVYGMHNNISEGPPYPIRTVSDGQYRYIRNLKPNEIFIEKHLMGWSGDGKLNNPYWSTWLSGSSTNHHTYRMVKRYMHRPSEQLYHTVKDPYEMTDLANDPALSAVKARLSAELDRWMQDQGDPGPALDTPQAHKAAQRGLHMYGPVSGP